MSALSNSEEAVLAAVDQALAAGADGSELADHLFAMVGALDSEVSMRRVLTEPPVPVSAKLGLLRALVGERVPAATMDVLVVAVSHRWPRGRQLADGLERAAVCAAVSADGARGEGDSIEDALFRFNRIVEANPALNEALSDPAAPLTARRQLLERLVSDKLRPSTYGLLLQALNGRHGTLMNALAYYQRVAAARFERLVATVWTAAALTEEQKTRMIDALSAQYGQRVHLNEVVEPSVLGGVRVRIGDEVIDSTVAARLADIERRLAG